MNWLIFISGLFALATVIGHFTMGIKSFLRPMMEASFDEVPKKIMQSVFHYVSTFLVLSAIALLLHGSGVTFGLDTTHVARFIALNYSIFAVVQITIALTSNIPNPLTKLFQWGFFVAIAVFAWIGA